MDLFTALEPVGDVFKGLPVDRFNSEWRAVASIKAVKVGECEAFIRAHYLGKRPGVVTLCLQMSVNDSPVGMLIYAMPPREIDKRYGGKTWELARLYLLDAIPRNAETWFIGQSVKIVKRNHGDVKYLVSYADPSANHSGLIYKAANWTADGRTDDERKTPRCDYADDTGKKYSRRSHVPDGVQIKRVPRVSKFRFVYKLDRSK